MNGPKILLLDIETSPHEGYFWGQWNQNIPIGMIKEPTKILCWAAKWHGQKTVHFRRHTEEDFLTKIYDLIGEADGIVHYNGKSFDMKHLNREFLLAKMGPPPPYKNIDLLTTVRTNFKFASNKMEWVSIQMGYEGKVKHRGFELWTSVMAGDEKAWREMRKYNVRDVVQLEEMHDELLPWIKGYPNFGLFVNDDDPRCINCGSKEIIRTHKPSYTAARMYNRYHCEACGKWQRGRFQCETTGKGVLK